MVHDTTGIRAWIEGCCIGRVQRWANRTSGVEVKAAIEKAVGLQLSHEIHFYTWSMTDTQFGYDQIREGLTGVPQVRFMVPR